MRSKPFFFITLGIFFLLSCAEQTERWTITDKEEGVLILEGSDSVLFYQRATKSFDGKYARANYIHPLYSLKNTRLTEDFPADHLHHRGIFWAWHQNYVGEKSVGDAWALENFSWDVTNVQVDRYPDSCVLRTEVYWQSPIWLNEQGAQKPFVKEEAVITIHTAQENYRLIDFQIELQALEDSLFIGGSEDVKGYSGFSWRISLPEDITFTGENGKVEPQNPALDAGPWINMYGNIDGQTGQEGVLVISRPGNPNHPQPWILRSTGSMQNVVYPGREKVMINRQTPLVLKYRMIVYQGELEVDSQFSSIF